MRPSGIWPSSAARTPGEASPAAVRGVSTIPGPIPLTLIPRPASVTASERIIISTAPLEASYMTLFFSAASELVEPTQTMLGLS